MRCQRLRHQVGRVAADAGHGVDATQLITVCTRYPQVHGFVAHLVHAEASLIKQTNEGA
ncbi:hypothetical protein D3C72_2471260 [compost metagenome]